MTNALYGLEYWDYLMIIWWIIETLKMVKLKNGHHFVTVNFVVEKDAEASLMFKFREVVKTDTRFEWSSEV